MSAIRMPAMRRAMVTRKYIRKIHATFTKYKQFLKAAPFLFNKLSEIVAIYHCLYFVLVSLGASPKDVRASLRIILAYALSGSNAWGASLPKPLDY